MRLAVFTTVHPLALPWIGEFLDSLERQSDRNFDLWIGVDRVSPNDVQHPALKGAHWIERKEGTTAIDLRNTVLREISASYDGVVLADSDDIIEPERIASVRDRLSHCDVVGCGLRLIDATGQDLCHHMGYAPGEPIEAGIVTANLWGFSNTAWRCPAMAATLPAPSAITAMDWHCITRAWLNDARLEFDDRPHMRYRQYGANTARVTPPFSAQDLESACRLAIGHYESLLRPRVGANPKVSALERAKFSAYRLYENIRNDPQFKTAYLSKINAASPLKKWWSHATGISLEGTCNP